MTFTPQIDQLIPKFHVQDIKGQIVSPDRFLGHPYVLYFYPKNDTPGCTKEACDFRDRQLDFMAKKAPVIGVSPDSESSHEKFMSKYQLEFIFISDPFYELCSLFGVWEEKKSLNQIKWGVIRTTFVIDAKGIIRWIEKPVQVEGHAERVLQALENLPQASDPL